jgi:ribonuclease BN (tRNA processing enzyme)
VIPPDGMRWATRNHAAGDELVMHLAGLEVVGTSIAALATAFAIPRYRVAVDMGRCSPTLAAQDTVLLTHCHSDHVAGLVAWLSAHTRRHEGRPTRVVVPAERRDALVTALSVWPDLDGVRRRVDLETVVTGASPGDAFDLDGGAVTAIPAEHPVPSLGWALSDATDGRPRLVFAGDGSPQLYGRRPELLDSDAAVVDCSFVAARTLVAARLSGHGHVSDWNTLRPDLPCDELVLAHLPADLDPRRLADAFDPDASGPTLAAWWPEPVTESSHRP